MKIATRTRKLNLGLARWSTHSPDTYYPELPIAALAALADSLGFNGAAFDGIYTGHDGRSAVHVGEGVWVALSWHRMGSGNIELIAYAS